MCIRDSYIGEVALWNEKLSDGEITALYNGGAGLSAAKDYGSYTSSSGLKGYWKMNDAMGTSVADASGNNNPGTISGATWIAEAPKGFTGRSYNIVPKKSGHKAWHGTIATYFDNLFVTGPIDWEEGSNTSSNSNSDLYMTFSKDGGEKWGTDDYSWYYWRDLNDKPDYRPVATYGENGVLGFAWTYDGDLNFRTNSTGDFLQGWNPATGSDVNSNGPIYIAPTILDSTFHYAYSCLLYTSDAADE